MRGISPFKLERYYSQHEFTTKYLLCPSDCESYSIAELLSMDTDSIDDFVNLKLGYTETTGSPLLRREIALLYKNIQPKEILIHSGAQEAIFLFLQAFLEAGDHVIVQTPCYQSFVSVPQQIGCSISEWEIRDQSDWIMDLDELERLIQKNTRLICINSPNNPTGFHFTNEEFYRLVSIARENNIVIFSDEVYRFIEYDESALLPAVCEIYENGISLGVMSKSFGLAGVRIGWLATSRHDILHNISILKEYTSICNSAPSEYLSVVALKNKKRLLERNLRIVKKNLLLAESFFSEYPELLGWVKPKAGPVTFVRLLVSSDSEKFANKLLTHQNVLILPGEIFERPGFFRIGFGRKNFAHCLDKFSIFLKSISQLQVK